MLSISRGNSGQEVGLGLADAHAEARRNTGRNSEKRCPLGNAHLPHVVRGQREAMGGKPLLHGIERRCVLGHAHAQAIRKPRRPCGRRRSARVRPWRRSRPPRQPGSRWRPECRPGCRKPPGGRAPRSRHRTSRPKGRRRWSWRSPRAVPRRRWPEPRPSPANLAVAPPSRPPPARRRPGARWRAWLPCGWRRAPCGQPPEAPPLA
jgi:hypothetical protein